MAHQTPEDADGVEDPDCADVPNVQLETDIATSAIIKRQYEKVCRQDSTRRINLISKKNPTEHNIQAHKKIRNIVLSIQRQAERKHLKKQYDQSLNKQNYKKA